MNSAIDCDDKGLNPTSFNNVAVFFFGFSLRYLPKLRQNSQANCVNVSLEHRFLSGKIF